MNNPIDRAAKVYYENQPTEVPITLRWEDLHPKEREYYRSVAKKVIEAYLWG